MEMNNMLGWLHNKNVEQKNQMWECNEWTHLNRKGMTREVGWESNGNGWQHKHQECKQSWTKYQSCNWIITEL